MPVEPPSVSGDRQETLLSGRSSAVAVAHLAKTRHCMPRPSSTGRLRRVRPAVADYFDSQTGDIVSVIGVVREVSATVDFAGAGSRLRTCYFVRH